MRRGDAHRLRAPVPLEVPEYRRYIGHPGLYDRVGALQFALLTLLGLREHHNVLDVGCGSLRAGRLLIPFLEPGRYFGIEPNDWLVSAAIEHELGPWLLQAKRPVFSRDEEFRLSAFGVRFDFILAISIFSHASQASIRRALGEAAVCLADDGKLVATYVQGEEDYAGDAWHYRGSITYRQSTMVGMIHDAGLACVSLQWSQDWNQDWLLIARRGVRLHQAVSVRLRSLS